MERQIISKKIPQKHRVEEGKAMQAKEGIQVEEEDILVNVATTANGWDICHACVGNLEKALKNKALRKMEEEVVVVGPVLPFLA